MPIRREGPMEIRELKQDEPNHCMYVINSKRCMNKAKYRVVLNIRETADLCESCRERIRKIPNQELKERANNGTEGFIRLL